MNMRYTFDTTTTMKPYNNKKWWISDNIIRRKTIEAKNLSEALKKYQDKLDYVHFKDVDQKVYETVLGEKIRFFDGCCKGAMCPIGTGALDYPAIKAALEEIGYSGYITIEQERDPRNSDTSLRDVKRSVDYLKSVGYQI